MPIYEYKCKKCGKEFENWLTSFSESNKTKCPECNSKVSRLISSSSFVLKGTGWYATDYGSQRKDKKIEKKEKVKDSVAQDSI